MGCGCNKGKTGAGVARAAQSRTTTAVRYEVFGGDMDAPETFATLSEARAVATAHSARVRSTVVREPAEAAAAP